MSGVYVCSMSGVNVCSMSGVNVWGKCLGYMSDVNVRGLNLGRAPGVNLHIVNLLFNFFTKQVLTISQFTSSFNKCSRK